MVAVEVTFYKLLEKRVSTWDAVRGKRTRIPGTTIALGRGGMPHDLTRLIVEASIGLHHGFWGSVASGATFRSTGRKRTRPGRAVIAENRRSSTRLSIWSAIILRRWASGAPTPCRQALDEFTEGGGTFAIAKAWWSHGRRWIAQ